MDGTLVDTERYWMAAEEELVESFGGRWTHEDALGLVGSGLWESARVFQAAGVDLDADTIVARLTARVQEQLAEHGVPWRPGARELLEALRVASVPTALVTMSVRSMADDVVRAIPFEAFDVIVTGDAVGNAKPHPEPYLTAADGPRRRRARLRRDRGLARGPHVGVVGRCRHGRRAELPLARRGARPRALGDPRRQVGVGCRCAPRRAGGQRMSESRGERSGPFRAGDRVQLTGPKGRMHTITLEPGKLFHTHKGPIAHDDLIGQPDGSVVANQVGVEYLALRPLLSDFVMSMPRGAAIVYPKDAAQILAQADVFPGATVVEAGVGSGALSLWLLRAIGPAGRLMSFERREEFADVARGNVATFLGYDPENWSITLGDLAEALPGQAPAASVDRVVLDMLAPWECIDVVSTALKPGGVLLCYIATVTQLSRVAEAIRATGDVHGAAVVRDDGARLARARVSPCAPTTA